MTDLSKVPPFPIAKYFLPDAIQQDGKLYELIQPDETHVSTDYIVHKGFKYYCYDKPRADYD